MKYDRGTDPFYSTGRWKHLRQAILRRDSYQCQMSKREKFLPDPATVVHHILPREIFPEFQWSPWNLISLSAAAHNRMHDRETDRLTREGINLAMKTARKRGMDPAEVYKKITE